jgi:hypothetical protein
MALQSPQFFILNLAVGGSWPGNPDANTVFPANYYVDCIRVYKLAPASSPTAPPPADGRATA